MQGFSGLVDARHRSEQAGGVRMRRRVKYAARVRFLHDAARVHDGDAVSELGDDAEIVRDEHE
jgi:hypothetical protein